MTSFESNHKNAVEVDGIRFETLMPERVVKVLANQEEAPTALMDLGIRITNNTPTALCFSFYSAFTPELMMPDGQIRQRGGSYFSDWLEGPRKSDFPIALSGETVTFSPGAAIYTQQENQFQLLIFVGNGGYWIFDALYPGTYQIRLKYGNKAKKVRAYDPEILKNKLIENIWTGEVLMPFVEFSLVSP